VEFKGLLAIHARTEMAVDVLACLIGYLTVDEGFKFSECFVAVSHGGSHVVWSTPSGAAALPPRLLSGF
jgi:hypothetical protein